MADSLTYVFVFLSITAIAFWANAIHEMPLKNGHWECQEYEDNYSKIKEWKIENGYCKTISPSGFFYFEKESGRDFDLGDMSHFYVIDNGTMWLLWNENVDSFILSESNRDTWVIGTPPNDCGEIILQKGEYRFEDGGSRIMNSCSQRIIQVCTGDSYAPVYEKICKKEHWVKNE